jgi:tetratricopeptide (TPR) repeat protein
MPNPKYEYQIGGSLPEDAPTYVRRQADQDFYQYLKNSEFCYVLNARQMGKSSLQIRTMHRLQDEGFASAVIDVSSIGSEDTTQEQWYAGIIRILVNNLGLKRGFDLETWWQTHSLLSPVQHFSLFIEEILLTRISKNIVIFIDESEGIHHFHFGQDFFVLIRSCYNQRSDNPAYNRLTFAILGVASPSDLIANKKLTPFNIGRAIDLSEFQLGEALPLAEGLTAKTNSPETLLQIVLEWTGGQPFLTHKLCKLISDSDAPLSEGQEAAWIEQLVKTKIIAHWESQDEPMHLRNIRNRILHEGGQKTGRLLEMYQQVLQQGEMPTDDSREQLDLRLSGLVVRRKNKLLVYNRIYVLVFDNIWIENTLATLRPYAESFNAWRDSKSLDESYLLRGLALQKAQNWAKNKSLSEADHRFLNASQTLEQREIEKALKAQIQANQFKAQRRTNRILAIFLMITLGLGGVAVWQWWESEQQRQLAEETEEKLLMAMKATNTGVVYGNFSQYEKILAFYKQMVDRDRQFGHRRRASIDFSNIGTVYQNLGQYQKALGYYQEALRIHSDLDDKRGIATGFFNMGEVYQNLGQYKKALDYYQKALEIHRELSDRRGEGDDLTKIGEVYHNLGQYQQALEYYQQALAIHRKIGDKRGEGEVLSNIGAVYQNLDQYHKAKTFFQESATILETLGVDILWKAQRGLASVEFSLHQSNYAIIHYEQAFDNIEKLRGGLTEKEHKLSFMQNKLSVYEEFLEFLQIFHQAQPNKHYDRKALEIFERKQSRIFLKEMGESGARRFAGIPEEISQVDQEFEQQIATIRKSRTEALAQGKNAEPHRKQLEKLQAKQADFEKTLKTDYPAYYAIKYPKTATLETLQKDVLQTDELMLIYNVREKATDLWVVSKEHFAWFTVPLTEEQVQQKITAFRDVGHEFMLSEFKTANERKLQGDALMRHLVGAIEENLPDFVESSYALYQKLLPEVARQLVAKAKPSTLYIVPTGALYSLPFESLVTEPDEDEPRYLLQDYAIAYLSSASLLKTLREGQHRRELTEREPLLAFANPVYPQDKSCKALSQGDSIKNLRTRAYQKLLGGEGICFPSLPETADEVEAIAK